MKKIFNIILTVLAIALCLGIKLVFHACGAKDDGSYMACHWAEQAVFGISIALVIMSILLLLIKDGKIKAGIAIGMTPVALVTAFIPKTLINLCMMTDMRCHSIMRPAVMIISIIIAIVSVVCFFLNAKDGESK